MRNVKFGGPVGWMGVCVAALFGSSVVVAADRKPNIVVIVADDLGYAEVTCDGKQDIPTPRVASIAKNGTCFTNGYVTCPVCSPTRAGLLTGRYQQRFGHELNPGPAAQADSNFGLPLDQVTLADRLKKLGYATGMSGKWHLGYASPFHPTKRGFDEFFGFLGGAHSYVNSAADPNNRIWRGEKTVDETAYLTDAIGREAAAFVEKHKSEPFFLYMPFNAVHAPLQTPEKYRDRFSNTSGNRQTFSAMLSALDDNVGLVLDTLAAEKLEDNTLIFFISDNGGPTRQTTSKNDPLHGFKAQVWEGGVRVPYMVQWKGHIPAGKVYDQPVTSLDIVPTALAAAGRPADSTAKLDGVDLLPYLDGKQTGKPHDKLYWRFRDQWAIRSGDWKLLVPPEGGSPRLFDLASDIGETKDLAAAKPEIAQRLQSEYDAWNSELIPPRWQTERAGAGKGKAGKQKAKQKQAS